MDTIFIFGAKYLFVFSIIIAGIYFLKQPRLTKKNMFVIGLLTLISIYTIATIAGHLYYNPRPFVIDNFTPLIPHANDNGFPSDHTLLVSAIASILFLYNRRVSAILWLIAIFVAVSRVYVGVHHPIDVIGSIIISIVITAVVWKCFKRFTKKL